MAGRLSRVAVVGGGPAGSFFALCLSQFALKLGLATGSYNPHPPALTLTGNRTSGKT